MSLSSLFRVYETGSFIHQLDPRTKLIFLAFVSFLAVFLTRPLYLILLFGCLFLIHLCARIPWKRTKYLYLSYPFLFFFIALGQGFFYWGPNLNPLFTLISKNGAFLSFHIPFLSDFLKHFPGELVFHQEGFWYGLIQSCRTATLLTGGLTLALTTHPMDILYALRKFKLPYELCFIISMSLRFFPQMIDEIRENLRAQKARGFILKKFGLRDKIRALIQVFETLVIRWIQGVRDMALAIDLRGFRLYPNRTFVHERSMQTKDFVVLGSCFLLFCICVFI